VSTCWDRSKVGRCRHSIRNWCCQCAAWRLWHNRNYITASKWISFQFKDRLPANLIYITKCTHKHVHTINTAIFLVSLVSQLLLDLPSPLLWQCASFPVIPTLFTVIHTLFMLSYKHQSVSASDIASLWFRTLHLLYLVISIKCWVMYTDLKKSEFL